jgi:hypothetical protein
MGFPYFPKLLKKRAKAMRYKMGAVPRAGIDEANEFNDLAFPNFAKAHTESHRVFRGIPKLLKRVRHVWIKKFLLRNPKLTPHCEIEVVEVGQQPTSENVNNRLVPIASHTR